MGFKFLCLYLTLQSKVMPRILTVLVTWTKDPATTIAAVLSSVRVRLVVPRIIASDLS